MNTKNVSIDKVADYIWNELKDWSNNVEYKLDEACGETIKEAKTEIKNLSKETMKRRKGKKKHYTSCFTTKKPRALARQLYNTKVGLSHLLEDGHYVYNQYGGPYQIKKRTVGASATITDNQLTGAYGMWKKTHEDTEQVFYDNAIKKINEA